MLLFLSKTGLIYKYKDENQIKEGTNLKLYTMKREEWKFKLYLHSLFKKYMLNNKVLHFIFTIFCFLAFNSLFAQTPNFKHFTVDDGLPSSECYQILQDKKGYIWISTDKGVSRYNGVKFQIFTKEDGLPENCIVRMYEDQLGRIWFAGISNQIAFYEKNKMTCLKINYQILKQIKKGYINSMSFSENCLFLGMHASPHYYKITFSKGNSVNPLKYQKLIAIKNKNIISAYIIKLKNNEFINGLNDIPQPKYNVNSFNFVKQNKNIITTQNILRLPKKTILSSPNIRCVKTKDGGFYFYNNLNILKINKNGVVKDKIEIADKLNCLFLDSKKGMWIGQNKKGLSYFPSGNINDPKPLNFLKNNSISAMCEDHEHGFWITTLDNGVYYLKNLNFTHLTDLSSSIVNSLFFKNRTLYAGMDNGRIVIYKNNVISEIDINKKNDDINFITKICENQKNSIAISGNHGFFYLDLISKKTKPVKTIYPFISGKLRFSVFSVTTFIKRTKENDFIAAGGDKLIKIYETNKTKIIPIHSRIYSLAEGEKGIIWLGCINGLFSYDGNKIKFHGKQSIALSNRINEIQLKKNTIWVSTKDNGVCIKRGNHIYNITKKNGLISNICQSILLENDRTAWISTNKGICKIKVSNWKPFKFKLKTYNTNNGLISNEVNQVIKDVNTVYIASNKGISWFDESETKPNIAKPPIFVTSIQINKRDTSIQKKYILPYYKNNITFNYIGLTYKSEGDIEYKYKLIGLDTNWNFTHTSTIPYTTLPYGKYSFIVSAKNNDGYWSKNPDRIDFIIIPPFWHTWYFRVIAGLSFLASIYFFIKWRINKVEKRAFENSRLYQQTVEMEMKFLSSQMNPHFTFNAMNSIQYYLLENEPEKAQKYLVKYSKLIRKVLENNMKKYVSISEEVEMLGLYMDIESVRFEIQFEYEIQISDAIKELNISIPPMIVQPYIENAIWHGISHKKETKGKITVSYELIEAKIKCSVEDNGIGRKKSKELNTGKTNKESLGMLITHQRLQQLHSESEMDIEPEIIDLVNENGEGCGTRIVIYLPFVR